MGSVDEHLPSSLLESLPARPPTPPRETQKHDLDILPQQLIAPRQFGDHLRSLQTPPGGLSPTSSSTLSTTRRKRVGFSAQAQYQEPPVYTDRILRRQNTTPVSLPPTTSRPVKGILKPSSTTPNRLGPADGVYLGDEKSARISIADMLESTLQQLAGADRESRVDAYTMLFRGLKASSNLPDRIALQSKMSLFMQFIQRDLGSRTPNGSVDILLVTSAIKLLHTFLHFHGIASSIPYDFGVFLVDHSIRSFEDVQVPKEVVRHLMQALFLQNFSPDVMTSDRVGRLVTALHKIEDHLTGKSIVQSRVIVYEKLVRQCPHQMATHSDWLQDLFSDMLSSFSEIRSAAINWGLSAAFALNRDQKLVNRVLELLNVTLEDKKYVAYVTERLEAMLKPKDESSASVPKIWSVITLFIPNPDQWDYFKPWSRIIQHSFNHSNPQTKREANLAWCRFTYRIYLDRRLNNSPNVARLIREPFISLIRRKALREHVLGGICNFYYYTFRPDMNLKTLDENWDMAVVPVMQGLVSQGESDNASIAQAATILAGLIDCKTRRVWREDRVVDSALVKDDELPAIESKWIRANSLRVFELVGPVLEKGFAELSVAGTPFQKLWRAFVLSVAFASVKDVKLHDDTAKFVAGAFTFLLKVWTSGPRTTVHGKPCSPSQFLDSAREFILILIKGLGLLPNPFIAKQFYKTEQNQFIVNSAHSSRSGKKQKQRIRRSPLQHLFCFLSDLPPGVPDDDVFADFLQSVFAPFFDDKSEKAQADLAQELLRLLPMTALIPYGPWVMSAAKISTSLESSQQSLKSSGSGSGASLGLEFREFVKVLERGLRSVPNLPWEHWLHIFHAIRRRVRDETGDAGVAITVVEQLAIVVKDLVPDEKDGVIAANCFYAALELIAASTQPRDQQAADAARRRLWGTSNAGIRPSSYDSFDSLYKLITSILGSLYEGLKSYDSTDVGQMLDEVKGFFERSNRQLILRALVAIQDSLARWLEDEEHRITRADHPGVAEAMYSLWQRICNILIDTSSNKLQLEDIEPLLCAAFRSTHHEIVRITAEMWNRIYENVDHIDYPETLKIALASLGSSVDVARPGLDIVNSESDIQRPNFTESQEDMSLPIISHARLEPTPRSRPFTSHRLATPGSSKAAGTSPGIESTTPLARVKSKGRTPKAKLRHEDSQVQFAPIESSPAPLEQESQFLTEHQKEIRDRQRENAALFPGIRSSPGATTKKAQKPMPIESPGPHQASTPEHDGGFEDYLTSTPTPRRGQPMVMADQDQEMADPPSSPPELRSGRLLAELKSQVNSSNSLDEWQFSSSPISGSPNSAHRTVSASQPVGLNDINEELRLDDTVDVAEKDDSVEVAPKDVTSSQLEAEPDVIEETVLFDKAVEANLPGVALTEKTAGKSPATPSGRKLRSQAVQVTPRSDNEEFVDALSSPMVPTPSRRAARPRSTPLKLRRSPRNMDNSRSFNVSDSFENGMRNVGIGRIAIEIRSSPRKKDIPSYDDILPESPEQEMEQQAQEQQTQEQQTQEHGALDCILVEGGASKRPCRGRPRKSRPASISQNSPKAQITRASSQASQASQDHIPSTPNSELARPELQDSFENISPGSGRWWRKRKGSSSIHSSGGKRCRMQEPVTERELSEVPDSQTAAAAIDKDFHIGAQTAEELYEDDFSFALDQSSIWPGEQRAASEELPSALDEPDEPMGDVDEFTDDEDAIQSQLARESKQGSPVKEDAVPLGRAISAEPEPVAPVDEMAKEVEEATQEQIISEEQPVGLEQPEPNKFDRLMGLLQNGLDVLRSAEFTREETYKVEDMFMDIKRELYSAERRGRQ